MLHLPSLFTACSSIPFFNSFFVTYGTPCCARGHQSHLIFYDLQDTMSCQRSLLSSLTTFVTYGTPCHARGHHSSIYGYGCASAYIFSLLATSLINNSGLIFICVKIMNIFTCGEEISKLAV